MHFGTELVAQAWQANVGDHAGVQDRAGVQNSLQSSLRAFGYRGVKHWTLTGVATQAHGPAAAANAASSVNEATKPRRKTISNPTTA